MIELAKYETTAVSRYRGNPLIEALPPVLDVKDWPRLLLCRPEVTSDDLRLPAKDRCALVLALYQVFVPLPVHLVLAREIDLVLREGYVSRDPLDPETQRRSYRIALSSDPGRSDVCTARTIFVHGLSRIGKSRGIERIFETAYTQVILHREYRARPLPLRQVTYLHVGCPSNASLRDFNLAFFDALDQACETSEYLDRASRDRSNLNLLVRKVCREISLGVLIVDELQNLLSPRSQGKENVQKFLHSLVDTVGIPVIFVGNPRSIEVFVGSFQETGRIAGHMTLEVKRPERGSKEWRNVASAFWNVQWLKAPTPYSAEIGDVLWDCVQGVLAIVPSLLYHAQCAVIRSGEKTKFSSQLLQSVMDGPEMSGWRPALAALKANRLSAFDDITPFHDLTKEITKTMARSLHERTIKDEVNRALNKRFPELDVASSASTVHEKNDVDSAQHDPRDLRIATTAKNARDWLREQGHMVGDLASVLLAANDEVVVQDE